MYEGPGLYEHYRGGIYRAIGIAMHESTGARTVVYNSLSADHELAREEKLGLSFINRPLDPEDGPDAWNEDVLLKGEERLHTVPRFRKINA